MPIPLIWLGAGVAAWAAGHHLNKAHHKQKGVIHHYPGESTLTATPINGSVVCCGIYEVFDHSGIWYDNHIIELAGNGLIRAISPERFLDDRSGEQIFVACDTEGYALTTPAIADRAAEQIFQYCDYHVISNNCHRFVEQCITGNLGSATLFSDLNSVLSEYYQTAISWRHLAH